MPVRFNINESAIQHRMNNPFGDAGLAMLSSEILENCNRFCKERSNALIASSYIHSRLNEGLLIWQTPYAARQYYEIRTAYHDKNPEASWRWCEVAKQNFKDRWVKKAQAIARLYG